MSRIRTIAPRLHVCDLQRAVDFYTGVLGFTVDAVSPPGQPPFAMVTRDGSGLQLGGIDGRRAADQRSTCTLWIDVEDVQAIHREIAHRVPIEWGPDVYFYHRREFGLRDPDGNLIVLSEETDDPVTCPQE